MNRFLKRGMCFLGVFISVTALLFSSAVVSNALAQKNTAAVVRVSENDFARMIADAKGKVLVFNFFATWCPPCRHEIPELIALRKRYDPAHVTIIGISLDHDTAALERFVSDTRFTYPVCQDDGSIATALGIRSIPHNMVIAEKKDLIFNQAGIADEATLSRIIDSALSTHANR